VTTRAEQHRHEAEVWANDFLRMADDLGPVDPSAPLSFIDTLIRLHLDALVRDLEAVVAGQCPLTPEIMEESLGTLTCPICHCFAPAPDRPHEHDHLCLLGLDEIEDANG
jgi:hypothetical protein